MDRNQSALQELRFIMGLETHAQLKTKSKLFCNCINSVYANDLPPNTAICDVCLGMPGTKPRLNKKAVEIVLKIALALNCKINKEFFFSRKTYFYPDLAKNYQITQYEIPVGVKGYVKIHVNNKEKIIRIKRVHIEEDPAKIIHRKDYVLVDYNRSGVPLVEIVTEPDFNTPEEIRAYLNKIMQILEYIDAFDSSKGTFKSDLNISIEGIGERVEVKNITGIKEVEIAANYEIIRQKNIILRGGRIERETRRWDESKNITLSMRKKETEEDYGYIFEPDLPSIIISDEEIDTIKQSLPELPDVKIERLMREYNINRKLAESLASEKEIADLFERCVKREGISIKNASTWVGVVLRKILNYNNLLYRNSGVKDEWIIDVIKWYEEEKYNDYNTEMIMRKIFEDVLPPEEIIKKYGFKEKIRDESLREIVKKVIEKYPNAVQDYHSGKEKALEFLVGMVLKETKGSADPKLARKILLEILRNK